ncbi:MAG: hypothetical protein Q7K26_01355 [bacterium]|nr:hypothetical protein [bacterium]
MKTKNTNQERRSIAKNGLVSGPMLTITSLFPMFVDVDPRVSSANLVIGAVIGIAVFSLAVFQLRH